MFFDYFKNPNFQYITLDIVEYNKHKKEYDKLAKKYNFYICGEINGNRLVFWKEKNNGSSK